MSLRRVALWFALHAACGCVERGEVLTRARGVSEPDASSAPRSETEVSSAPDDLPSDGEPRDSGTTEPTQALPSQSAMPLPEPDSGSVEPAPSTDSGSTLPSESDAGPEPEPPDSGAPQAQVATGLSSGNNHVCAVFGAGVACWGSNSSGQLGLGDAVDRVVPTLISDSDGWSFVRAGAQHSCAIDASGTVLCWGANDRGQLATGDRLSRPTPTAVSLPAPARTLATRFNHVCAILNDDAMYCWGENFEGQLGQGDPFPGDQNPSDADALSPLLAPGGAWLAVDTGQGHTCAIASDSSLWCWGRNTQSQLGGGTEIQLREPRSVDAATDWASISSGQTSNCALKVDGTLWCWGENLGYDTGEGAPLGLEVSAAPGPTQVGTESDWSQVSTRIFHTCGLRAGDLWCWGRGIEGQLGLGDLELRQLPTEVSGAFTEVSAGAFGTCALTSAGSAVCTGKNDVGELGTGDAERRSVFTPVLAIAR